MLISHYEHLVAVEARHGGGPRPFAARSSGDPHDGSGDRTGPLPWLRSGDPGREIEGPMAIVILGGLMTSTALSLFVLPTLALRFGRFRPGEASEL
jgi:hypothetical protein